jgi:hypothetical protein
MIVTFFLKLGTFFINYFGKLDTLIKTLASVLCIGVRTIGSMEFRAAIYLSFKKTRCSLSFIVINVIIINFD